jgi:hypothetical protein
MTLLLFFNKEKKNKNIELRNLTPYLAPLVFIPQKRKVQIHKSHKLLSRNQ